ncbi:DnaJ domain-containing protein [Haloarcula salinisoli]|uniref:DnaJ domain-containing protein n=1 Tax=Haloarcula salinisoli TaxID=2487746 RepID=A0A8J8C7J2_9EURY|nr:DnaJ domain-containing protein [Halomicroarcula salinisoli]MBX0285196.1 DnaJ domain-containing protein [Halomicroarcula salinisoli]MBX0303327.1 DnaJ domain-containing protein [Halomicroarcula salinisoli]
METLYGVIGVEPDADEQAIVRAYREQVKRHHPDVTDTQDAGEQFKRLTTAKEVLTDDTERARYDRLGHAAYAKRYLDDSWTVEERTEPTVEERTEPTVDSGTADSETISEAAQRMATESGTATTESRRTQHVDRSDGYATASEYYRPGQRVGVESRGGLGRRLAAVRDVLPWVLAHLVLLGGAVTLVAVLLTAAGGVPSVTTLFVAGAMVLITFGVSALHLSVALFR